MHYRIPRLYDSHTHFIATGEFSSGLHLGFLKSAEDLSSIDATNPRFHRGRWLVGFGWDDSHWKIPPHKDILDRIFPHQAVALARGDGHSCWLNSMALRELGIESRTGLLTEKDHLRTWDLLPTFTKEQQRQHVLAACAEFNKAGFTHIRDLTCSEPLWNLLVEMSEKKELTVAIEENYTTHDLNDFEKILKLCLEAKKAETPYLRMKGVKLFYDGSLGSQTAYLSIPYNRVHEGPRGKPLWSLAQVEEVIKKTWKAGLEFSVHVIGDQGAHDMVQLARKISAEGFVGRLNLEHAQILRPETIQMMKPLHVRCHMQPCHWLSDREWLIPKLGLLYANVFPWEALRLANIPISFGCDSPVEPSSFWRNKIALDESPKAGIKMFKGDLVEVHAHPDKTFVPNSYSVIEDGVVKEVVFDGRAVSI